MLNLSTADEKATQAVTYAFYLLENTVREIIKKKYTFSEMDINILCFLFFYEFYAEGLIFAMHDYLCNSNHKVINTSANCDQ